MKLHMIIWLYKSVYLKRKHERDVFNVWRDIWNEWNKKENSIKKEL